MVSVTRSASYEVVAETVARPCGSKAISVRSGAISAFVSVAEASGVGVTIGGGSNKATKDGRVSVVPMTRATIVVIGT